MSSERLPRSEELGHHISADFSTQTLLQPMQDMTSTQSSALPQHTLLPISQSTQTHTEASAKQETASYLDLQLGSQTSSLLMERQKRIFLIQCEGIQISSHHG